MDVNVTYHGNSRVYVDWRNPSSVKRQGLVTPPKSKLVYANDKVVVMKRAAYRENPGSRYSMLGRTYYPAVTIVYGIIETNGEDCGWCMELASY